MKKYLVSFFCFMMPFFVQAHSELFLKSGIALRNFVLAKEQGIESSYEAMAIIFSDNSMNYGDLRSAIRGDMVRCRRMIRKRSGDCDKCRFLLQHLKDFYVYVHENKECCKAIQFHNVLNKRYALAFNNPMIVDGVRDTPHLYGVDKSKYKYRAYFKQVAKDLAIIDKFEDTIHGDHGVLKAHNYVYKIELIRVRNHIYHHNMYKYETRYF